MSERPKWEYRVEPLPAICEVKLCQFGAWGWELVAVVGSAPHGLFYFKRRIVGDA